MYVETAGTKGKTSPTRFKCPDAPSVLVHDLPNPWREIQRGVLGDNEQDVMAWLISQDERLFMQHVDRVVSFLVSGSSVRVLCYGGKHRSRAVAAEAVTRYRGLGGEVSLVNHQ